MTDIAPSFPVLIDRDTILRRIHELSLEIGAEHSDEPPVFVSVIDGARTFASHLCKLLPGQPGVHEIRASSYGEGTVSSGEVKVIGGEAIPVDGKRVIILEDIVDTGRTVKKLGAWFHARGALAVDVATLLTKPCRRAVEVDLRYVGFTIEDHFVIGFGMDVAGRYRELPEVVIYDQALETTS